MRHTGTSIIMHNSKGEVLLLLRDDIPTIACPGMWDLPGGHLEEGETPAACIRREMLEEIETDVEDCLPFGFYPFEDRDEHIFELQIELDTTRTPLHEGQALRWFSKKEIATMELAYGFNEVLEDWFETRYCR